MKKRFLVSLVAMVALVLTGFVFVLFSTSEIKNISRSGFYLGNQVWSENIEITGDTTILGNLTVLPGTFVRFVVGDDQKTGDEVPADGYNDLDPTRLRSYSTTHSNLLVLRKIIAIGTKDAPITFTSASKTPTYADWEALLFSGNGSRLDSVIVEYSRNGVNPIGRQPNSVLQNSIVRHTLWGAVSSGSSPIQVLNNQLSDCGHEGVDIQSGSQIVRGNTIEDCHAGIVVLGGSPVIEDNRISNVSDGIHVGEQATPIMKNNEIILASPEQEREWRYGEFKYRLWDPPTVETLDDNKSL